MTLIKRLLYQLSYANMVSCQGLEPIVIQPANFTTTGLQSAGREATHLVCVAGFEPATSSFQVKQHTKLAHTQM